jgi:para-aminobenzoate synthetase
MPESVRTLLIDNHDSFTYNLFQLLAEVNGREPLVVRNDELEWAELARVECDNVVLSPGPGRPDRRRDFGVCAEAIRHSPKPLLGVCLGHQGLGWVYGGSVGRAPRAMHGLLRAVFHDGSSLFAGIPERFEAVRYHSLCLRRPLPAELAEIAWGEDDLAMAVAHRSRPQWGVQFHPESVASEHGKRLLANFRDLSLGRRPAGRGAASRRTSAGSRPGPSGAAAAGALELKLRRLPGVPDPERVFARLYDHGEPAFWLDSVRGGRFSFIGDAGGPLAATIAYDLGTGEVTVERGGETESIAEPVLDYLARELDRFRLPSAGLPFGLDCGFVGYLGYELKADCGATPGPLSPLPDAAFVFADRLLAFDHTEEETYVLCLVEPGRAEEAERWIESTAAVLAAVRKQEAPEPLPPTGASVEFGLTRSPERYLADIAACEEALLEGESYELCLTNSVAAEVDPDPFQLYRQLRRVNPASFGAYLRLGDLALLSSSPERFLAVDRDGAVESRPIKGTSPRGADREEDERLAAALCGEEKTKAENLMIVDLVRNDLGAVCEVGSVEVAALMEVESYATVHQLVSTVRGRLRADRSRVDCVRSCFPPGSMTGAPKRRTMEILDELEGAPRGPYAGAIGYFGLGGACDLSVTIRTIVLARGVATIGTGGAIVLQSDAREELSETLLKARAPMLALDPGVTDSRIKAWQTNFSGQNLSENS